MKAPAPLLLITVLQGLSGGMAVALSIEVIRGKPVSPIAYGVALALALIGGGASFTHMHHFSAGRYMLRGWRTSWLSREAITTGLYIAVLAATLWWTVRAPGVAVGIGWWAGWAAALGLFAMWVTAMVYASIPAMRSWHSPLTVVTMMTTGILGGFMVVLPFTGESASLTIASLVVMALWLGFRGLQFRFFVDARQGVNAATATGLSRAPHRLQDSGTTKPPYRSQTQIAPDLPALTRHLAMAAILWWVVILPLGLTLLAHVLKAPITIAGIRAASVVTGSFIDRWLFFRDATHSSRAWFADLGPSKPGLAGAKL